MKKTFIQIGKCVGALLYWALIWGIVWAFLCENNDENAPFYLDIADVNYHWGWASIFFGISFLSLGVCLYAPFLGWLYKAEMNLYSRRYDKIKKIVVPIMYVSGGLAFISFLIGLLGPLILTPLYGLYQLICFAWEFWLIILILVLISLITRITKVPALRTLSKIAYRMSLVCFIALAVYLNVYVWTYASFDNSLQEDSHIWASMILLGASAGVAYLLYTSLKKGVLTIAKFRYVLFLRAFKDENKAFVIFEKLKSKVKLPLMKIGNPDKKEDSESNEHYLPFSSWKYFLKFYMLQARALVFVAGTTDGLLWEVSQNARSLSKCVFIFLSKTELEELKEKISVGGSNKCNRLAFAIERVLTNYEQGNGEIIYDSFSAFVVRGDIVYVGDSSVLVNAVLKNDFSESHTCIHLDCGKSHDQESSFLKIGVYLFKRLRLIGLINLVEAVHNNLFRSLLIVLAYLIVFVFWIGIFALGVICLLYSALLWFVDDIGLDSYGTFDKIFLTIFVLNVGGWLIKTAVSMVRRDGDDVTIK